MELANFIFRIDNTILIKLVKLVILLGPIRFYIVFINILFLLFSTNINKLRIFFNNIINRNKYSQYSQFNTNLLFGDIVVYFYSSLYLYTL